MRPYHVDIVGLSNTAHAYDFELGAAFFEAYGKESLADGRFAAHLVLDKRETFIEALFTIRGQAALVCDRSLEPFDFPLDIHAKMVFKYGEEPGEVNEELTIIAHDQASLDVGQLMYEYILLAIPMKRLHPRFAHENEEASVTLVYQSQPTAIDESAIDPRWEQLKKLK
ncbi:MAG: DUF177 domain-containing protein [Cyclobacteriaceae bacterium]|nr:DUF177 domain-containing protein [Cyclobacteriaceae bacterium]